MADGKTDNRPLSPFMLGSTYRLQITSVLSILHRITGCAQTLAAVLIVFWFLGLAYGADSFAGINGFLSSWFGGLILIASLVAFWFHFCNGIRHLFWDMGYGFEIGMTEKTGVAVIAATAVLTVVTLIAAF